MDLTAELAFQKEQLSNEEGQLAQAQQILARVQQQVQFRRGCVAQVERLIEMQTKEVPTNGENADAG